MKRVLLVSIQGIGNTILNVPLIAYFSDIKCLIDMVISNNGSHEIFSKDPRVSELLLWDEKRSPMSNILMLKKELSKKEYDEAYALYPNGKRENIVLFLSRSRTKKSYLDKKYHFRLLQFFPGAERPVLLRRHDTINNLNLVGTDRSYLFHNKIPLFDFPSEDSSIIKKFIDENGLNDQLLIAIHPGGGHFRKRWDKKNYSSFIESIHDPGKKIILFGSSEEQPLISDIKNMCSKFPVFSFIGKTLYATLLMLAKCNLLVCNDSSLMHAAASLGINTVALWGYTDYIRTSPINPNSILVCVSCDNHLHYEFGRGHTENQPVACDVNHLSVEVVTSVVRKVIETTLLSLKFDPEQFEDLEGFENIVRLDSGSLLLKLNQKERNS